MIYDIKINFENIRSSKILSLSTLRDKAIASFLNRFGSDAEQVALGFALKLSVSGSNLDRLIPMNVSGHLVTAETFISCVSPKRGQKAAETELTVSRFCAAMADDISKYLDVHPDQVRTPVTGVPAHLSFPHNYYVSNLTEHDEISCIAWLAVHDQIMIKATKGAWRELSLKATAYFAAKKRAKT